MLNLDKMNLAQCLKAYRDALENGDDEMTYYIWDYIEYNYPEQIDKSYREIHP